MAEVVGQGEKKEERLSSIRTKVDASLVIS